VSKSVQLATALGCDAIRGEARRNRVFPYRLAPNRRLWQTRAPVSEYFERRYGWPLRSLLAAKHPAGVHK
jgi:hypothetical protein